MRYINILISYILITSMSLLILFNQYPVTSFAAEVVPETKKAVAHTGRWTGYEFDYSLHGKYWTIPDSSDWNISSYDNPNFYYAYQGYIYGSNSKNITIANFSSRGPTPDGLKKPDILAPGVGINSLANKQGEYHTLSGTSMATPVVAGCAALLYESTPNITPGAIKETLLSNAHSLGLKPEEQGNGVLNIRNIANKIEPVKKPNPSHPNSFSSGSFLSDNLFIILLIVIIILLL